MYSSITRKRNAYTFHFPNGQVTIDIDKHEEPIIGISGKPLRNPPRNVIDSYLGRLIYEAYYYGSFTNDGVRELIDRCISLGLNPHTIDSLCQYNYGLYIEKYLEKRNWKKILSYIRENEEEISNWSLSILLINSEITDICEKLGYTIEETIQVRKYFTTRSTNLSYRIDIKDFLKTLKPIFVKCRNFNEELKSFEELIKNYTSVEFRELAKIKYCHNINYIDIIRDLSAKYIDYLEIIKKWNLPKESGNFYKRYEVARKINYEYMNRPSEEIFCLRQESVKFAYEDDEIIVEVPKTLQDCEKIGKEFHNCVAGWEWNNCLATGYANLVVIREKGKTHNENKVCCDIVDGRIRQYYAPFNRSTYSDVLLRFRATYQNYLDSLYNN